MKVKVRLTKPLEHEGRPHAPGAIVELDEDRARWLVETVRGGEYVKPPQKHSKGD